MKLPQHIEQVVRSFQRIQGVGRKTAERYVFDIISHWKKESIQEFSEALNNLKGCTDRCVSCRAPTDAETSKCTFCSEERKNHRVVAVVASLRDL